MRADSTTTLLIPMLCVVLAGSSGCTTAKPTPAQAIAQAPACESLAAFDGATCDPLGWFDVLLRVARADAVFVGETHDDASGHKVEQALVAAFLLSHPKGAVSFEMLERDEQAALNDYLVGRVTLDTFLEGTKSRHWAGTDSWLPWYQPMIEFARVAGTPVVAANAPRTYVSRAMRDGYEPLQALPAAERAHFELDPALTRDGDWQRLKVLMTELHADRAHDEGVAATAPSDDDVDRVHRAQRVWDATMGASAAAAYMRDGSVIHFAGGFHLEERLGTVAQFMQRCPTARILIIALHPTGSTELEPKSVKGADIVVHTHAPIE